MKMKEIWEERGKDPKTLVETFRHSMNHNDLKKDMAKDRDG